jgi:putative nucleotidyltransferase with HDIG domain
MTLDIRLSNTPGPDSWEVDWEALLQSYPLLADLQTCPQSAVHHGEGDVAVHTQMVLKELARLPAWRNQESQQRQIVFAGALLHDIGKPAKTREENGELTSRGHSRKGEAIARVMLWEMGLPISIREQVTALIRYHQLPFFLVEKPDSERLLFRISQSVRCDHLALVTEADARGRICADQSRLLYNVALFVEYARDRGCLNSPRQFPSDHSRFQYFRSEHRSPDYLAYDDIRSEVVMMSGLPGAGKDHWIARNLPGYPVVSLDDLRREMRVDPSGAQGRVVSRAREIARSFLREGKPFVWNATNLTREVRRSCINLFSDYRARIRIVYVEAPPAQLHKRNRARAAPVREKVIQRLLDRWEIPDLTEAHQVDWITDG